MPCRLLAPLALMGVLLLSRPAHGQDSRPSSSSVLVLTEPQHQDAAIAAESFALALSIQLQGLELRSLTRQWSVPGSAARQQQEAHRRARAEGADFAMWYVVDATAGPPQAQVYLLRTAAADARFLALGAPQPGIERVMAMALRTMIAAELRGDAPVGQPVATGPQSRPTWPKPTRPPPPHSAVAGAPATAPVGSADNRLYVAAGYGLGLLALSPTLRHGPQGRLTVRLWHRLELELGAGWSFADHGSDGGARWELSVLDLTAAASHGWQLSRAWQLVLGGRARLGQVRAEARAAQGQQAATSLWELGLGPLVGARLRLHRTVELETRLLLEWLPVGHRLQVAGNTASDPGALLVGAGVAARLGVW